MSLDYEPTVEELISLGLRTTLREYDALQDLRDKYTRAGFDIWWITSINEGYYRTLLEAAHTIAIIESFRTSDVPIISSLVYKRLLHFVETGKIHKVNGLWRSSR